MPFPGDRLASKEPPVRKLIPIAAARLPQGGVYTIFGGRDGHLCACCQRAITPEDSQYDVCVVGHSVETLLMHRHCFQTWEAESLTPRQGRPSAE